MSRSRRIRCLEINFSFRRLSSSGGSRSFNRVLLIIIVVQDTFGDFDSFSFSFTGRKMLNDIIALKPLLRAITWVLVVDSFTIRIYGALTQLRS